MKQPTAARTILFLSANPPETKRLRLDEDLRGIRAGLRGAKEREQFRFESVTAVRTEDLRRAVLDLQPEFVHFSGHASLNGELVFQNEDGSPHYVGEEALAAFFENFSDHVRCVVLNACYTVSLAAAIGQHVDFVVGMNDAIEDDAAILYAVAFYDAVGAGQDIEKAHRIGCSAIQLKGVPGHLIPVLHCAPGASASTLGRRPAEPEATAQNGVDITTWLREISRLYSHPAAADTLLLHIGFPRHRTPNFSVANAAQFWAQVRVLLEDGVAQGVGLGDLLGQARQDFPGNKILKQAGEP